MGEHTDLKEIIDKLDDLFLYLSTVPTILFTVIQAASGEKMLLVFLPILIPTFVALYIGYIRGAITVNTIEERMRGWIYLIAAVLFYPIHYCIAYLGTSLLSSVLIGLLYWILVYYIVPHRLIPFFANPVWRERHKINTILLILTITASMFLSGASWFFSIFIFEYLHNGPNKYRVLFASMLFSLIFIITEILARRVVSKP